MATSYQPNIKDPRTQARIHKALGFVLGCFSSTKPHAWSSRYIDKHLGQINTDISKWLRKHLITTTRERYSKDTGICKEYIRNELGCSYVRDLITNKTTQTYESWCNTSSMRTNNNLRELVEMSETDKTEQLLQLYPSAYDLTDLDVVVKWAEQEYGEQLKTCDFTYDDKASRLFHPLQRVRKNYKKTIFQRSGLAYQYDIESCAPTLLLQYSQQIPEIIEDGCWRQGPMDLYLWAINRYIKERKQVREELAGASEMTKDQIKEIINAMFNGAKISLNPDTQIYHIVERDPARIEWLKQNKFVQELKQDIKTIWEYIEPTLYSTYTINESTGRRRKLPLGPKQKSGVYRDQERRVLTAVQDYLNQTNNEYFLEHDGWTTRNKINESDLLAHIYKQTGFAIRLTLEELIYEA